MQTESRNNNTQVSQGAQALPSALNIFEFQDYRTFLSKWFEFKKQTHPHYSGALFAKKAGLNSHTILGMVTRGERNLSHQSIRSFSRALGIKGREALYFEKLVLFNQSKNSEDKAYYLEQALTLSQGNGRALLTRIHNHAKLLSHWYIVAIREMVAFADFKPDPDWIVQKLKRKITKKQAEEAWKVLLDLGLVEQDLATQTCRRVHLAIDIDPGAIDFAIRNFHKEFLDRTKEAIDNEPLEDRELSSFTLAIAAEDLPKLREKIKEFRKQLNAEFPISKATPTQVVAVNTQMLALTERTEKK